MLFIKGWPALQGPNPGNIYCLGYYCLQEFSSVCALESAGSGTHRGERWRREYPKHLTSRGSTLNAVAGERQNVQYELVSGREADMGRCALVPSQVVGLGAGGCTIASVMSKIRQDDHYGLRAYESSIIASRPLSATDGVH